ncbi:hypothetical protein PG988_007432 [Apiospora saccharicola]
MQRDAGSGIFLVSPGGICNTQSSFLCVVRANAAREQGAPLSSAPGAAAPGEHAVLMRQLTALEEGFLEPVGNGGATCMGKARSSSSGELDEGRSYTGLPKPSVGAEDGVRKHLVRAAVCSPWHIQRSRTFVRVFGC